MSVLHHNLFESIFNTDHMDNRWNNQYLIFDKSISHDLPAHFNTSEARDGLLLASSNTLSVVECETTEKYIALIGDAVNADSEDSVEELVERALHNHYNHFLEDLQSLSGRYVAFFNSESRAALIPDARATLQVYYHDQSPIATSSPKLYVNVFETEQTLDPKIRELSDTEEYSEAQFTHVGDRSILNDLKKVLPNHVLNLNTNHVERRVLYRPNYDQPTHEYCTNILSNSMKLFAEDYEVHLPLTAGWDSRVLLSCSKDVSDRVKLFTYSRGGGLDDRDLKVPYMIANETGLDYSIHQVKPLTDEFKQKMELEHVLPRFLDKTRNVQFEYNNMSIESDLVISGGGGELLRGRPYYELPGPEAKLTAPTAAKLLGFKNNTFIINEIETWLPKAMAFSKKNSISILDLLYWEQRLGNWGAKIYHERDIGVNSISPYSNYNLLLAAMKTDREYRGPPDYQLAQEIISSSWPKLLKYDINPSPPTLKRKVYNNVPYPLNDMLEFGWRQVLGNER